MYKTEAERDAECGGCGCERDGESFAERQRGKPSSNLSMAHRLCRESGALARGEMPPLVLLLVLLVLLAGGLRAECPPCSPPCHLNESALEDCYYSLEGGTDLHLQVSARFLHLTCPPNVTLEHASLPRFPRLVRLSLVKLTRCAPPEGSYAAALQKLNVTVVDTLDLAQLPPERPLRADHFEGLPRLRGLMLQADSAAAAPGALLEGLGGLLALFVGGVRLPAEAMLRLPPRLGLLSARGVGLAEVPPRALARLPRLRRLVLVDGRLTVAPDVAAAPALRSLTLGAPLARMPPLGSLENATLWNVVDPRLRGGCGGLRRLRLLSVPAAELPAGWLLGADGEGCARLEMLAVQRWPELRKVAPAALEGAAELRDLEISDCRRLTELPPELFGPVRRVRRLSLCRNALAALPSELFGPLLELEQLDLSGNELTSPAVGELGSLPLLAALSLANNPLGDLCGNGAGELQARQMSPLAPLERLRALSLADTGATRVCVDWRTNFERLERLDLSRNNITQLQMADLQWERAEAKSAEVDLRRNPLRLVLLFPFQLPPSPPRRTVTLLVDSPLRCDCNAYWFARALRGGLLPAAIDEPLCERPGAEPAPLLALDEETMMCDAPEACPSGCRCRLRPRDEGLLLDCARRGLPSLPPLPAAAAELLAADNELTELPSAPPPALLLLDLAGNRLAPSPVDLAALLAPPERRVLLARNPLPCSCDLLAVLDDRRGQVADYSNVTCEGDGPARIRPAAEAWLAGCAGRGGARASRGALAGAALGALLAAALLLAGALLIARRNTRLRLKAFLLMRGLCRRWTDAADDDARFKYDAFVSFSHHDAAVAERLVAELEGGPRPLRLCVHHRDWCAGAWIPAQIAASVARSRRTVVLLSEHFARSTWARAEFREAHATALRDGRPRLVVVLLQARPPRGLDRELRHYVDTHTYVRWDEPAFWEKLRLALPLPREPAAPPAPAPPPAPVPAPTPPGPESRGPGPPTPVVKFAELPFPEPLKPRAAVTSPCA